jgi:hypothetical protein
VQCAKAVSGVWSWSIGGVPPLLEGGAAATVGSSWRSSSWSLHCSGSVDACNLVLGSVLPRVVDVRGFAVPAVGLLYSLCCGVVVPSLLLA